jgi:predicted dehydrogenase
MTKDDNGKLVPSRREFIKTSAAAAVGTALTAHVIIPGAYAAGSDTIRVGLIGCGGRGTGAATDVLTSAPGVKLVAMGDAFKDRLEESYVNIPKRLEQLRNNPKRKSKYVGEIDVPEDRRFVGFDAFEKVLASDVNYVILAAPPGFRPQHLKAAVAAGKNIFTEKPVAVDGPGIRSVLETYEAAKAKGLAIAAGTQRRHQTKYLETIKRLRDGAIGDILAGRVYWNQGGLWMKPRQESWSDMEWQIRNWLYFTWLSGDHIVEQHVHNLDVANWVLRGHPVRALGMGGRQARTEPGYGHIYDHFAIDYEYANGVHIMSMCRQIVDTDGSVSEAFVGAKGNCQANQGAITGPNAWHFREEDNQPYVQEHTDLIESIRSGNPINELKTVAESTLTAIMGRMSAYTGKVVTWDQALSSKESLMPAKLAWGSLPVPPVAIPGQTPLF